MSRGELLWLGSVRDGAFEGCEIEVRSPEPDVYHVTYRRLDWTCVEVSAMTHPELTRHFRLFGVEVDWAGNNPFGRTVHGRGSGISPEVLRRMAVLGAAERGGGDRVGRE